VIEFRLLGPLEVVADGRAIALPAAKPRALLALLLLDRGRVVSTDRLTEGLWGERPPETAPKVLQVYVSQLRKAVGAERLETRPPGYALRVEPDELDVARFERLLEEGRDALAGGDAAAASERLGGALALWRGPALAEFRYEPFAREAVERLDELRLAAIEERVEADLRLGRHAQLVPELEGLVAEHPLRERLRAQLMLALYRSGRQAEALEVYRDTRRALVEELGIDPGPELQELERAILRQDPELASTRSPVATIGTAPPSPLARRRLLPVLAAALALLVLGGALAFVSARRGGGEANDAELRTFVLTIENFLAQSHDARRTISRTIGAAVGCTIAPRVGAARIDRVQRNRQSLLQQLAALRVPSDERAQRASDLLQKAAHASIEADWNYRDWLRSQRGCPHVTSDFRAARAADARATHVKVAFLAAFNPLAQRYRQRVWAEPEF
jgi:DNA-binding SARP family transcriptional activator